ncbi:MAG: fatty acid desaturase [Myxococcales bacterium]
MRPTDRAPQDLIQASKTLRHELQRVSDDYRSQHPWLAHQNAIGLTIFLVSSIGIVLAGLGYASGTLPAWAVIPTAAFFMSLLHELEHDLIHRLYFKDNKFLYDTMMFVGWLFRPSTINPWIRRDLHLHHHRASGSESDLEERGITNGETWGVRRFLMTFDSMLAIFLRPLTLKRMVWAYIRAQKPASKAEQRRLLWRNRLSYFPLGTIHYTLWHFWLFVNVGGLVARACGLSLTLPTQLNAWLPTVNFLVVVWVGPNVLRSFCLHFVSSNMHYYGDIEPRNTIQQTQVWNAAWLLPLQLFCFNFGSTHGIHHFVVQEPFYLRQLVVSESHALMRKYGVRFNDFGTFRRNNRWQRDEVPEEAPQLAPTVAEPA